MALTKGDVDKIRLEKVKELDKHTKEWVAISTRNRIIGSGRTLKVAASEAKKSGDVDFVVFWVPPLDSSLALNESEV